ncbi:hypothetical protein AAMO2058_000786200 [Amorphochlora amoebiformis]
MAPTTRTTPRSLALAAVAASTCALAVVLVASNNQNLASATVSRSRVSSPVMQRSAFSTARSAPSTFARASSPLSRQQLSVHAAGEKTFTVDKPLGLKLGQGANGLVVKSATGNSAKAGIKSGETVIYTSSFFGDELWPSDKLSFTNSALKAAPSPVTIITSDSPVDVKRLVARPAPKRFGKRLSSAQKELATHLCLDCGYIYCDPTPFAELPNDYVCPQCASSKKRFASFDVATGKITEPISLFQIVNLLIVVIGLGVVAFLGYYGFMLS